MRSLFKLKYITLGLLLLAVASCGKKLDVTPKNSVDANGAITNEADLDAAVVGCYSLMAGGPLFGTSLLMDADLQASTGYCSWRGTFDQFTDVSLKTMTPTNAEASRIWTNSYRTINMANIVLAHLDIVGGSGANNKYEGEALFVRGTMLFYLLRFYALPLDAIGNDNLGVVIKTTATNSEDQAFERIPRSTVAQCYTQVINDLVAAAAKLPADNGTRANKYTALAMLSRVYLQKGDYPNARDAASTVIASGKYKMNAAVSAVFDNKNTAESIFEIQQNDQNNAGTANDGMATFYGSLVGIGRGDLRMNSNFIASYNPDYLRVSQWYYIGVGARPGAIYCNKWKSFSQNLPIIRIAEMYLTRAECNLRLGTSVGATPSADLGEIRNPIRVNLPVIAAPVLSDVLSERNFELAFEGVRIHDVKRLHGSTGGFAWDNGNLIFPIPQRDINATEKVLIQNEAYR